MRAMNFSAAVVSAFAVSGGAVAQTALEWKVAQGGNGHWYSIEARNCKTWDQCRSNADQRGGHLATINSAAERAWVVSLQAGSWTFLGGFQDTNAPDFSEPRGGWRWVTAEPFSPTYWFDGEPNNYHAPENCLEQSPDGLWNDIRTDIGGGGFNCQTTFAIEWEADCNGDGFVDYGQILAGELIDANGNGIPDCCELGGDCPSTSNLAINGGFEAGTPLGVCTSETVPAATGIGTGWMVAAGSAQRVRASAACSTEGLPKFGDFFIDLLDAGEIRQAVATTPGRSYRLSFWLSGDCAGGPAIKRVAASIAGQAQSFDHACSGAGTQAWRNCSIDFIANAAISTISLRSLAGGSFNGPLIDGVRVEDISISCAGDVDGSGVVDGGDISLVLLNFGPCQ